MLNTTSNLVLYRAHDSAYDTLSANPWCWCSDSEEYANSYCRDNTDKNYIVDRFTVPWSILHIASTSDIVKSMKQHSLNTFGEISVNDDGLTESDLWQFGYGENDGEIRNALLDDGFNCFRFPEEGSMQYCILDTHILGSTRPYQESIMQISSSFTKHSPNKTAPEQLFINFVENVCSRYGITEAGEPLIEGFNALCDSYGHQYSNITLETRMTPATARLHHYAKYDIARNPVESKIESDIISKVQHSTSEAPTTLCVRSLLHGGEVTTEFIEGLSSAIKHLSDSDYLEENVFSYGDPVEEPVDIEWLNDASDGCTSDDVAYLVELTALHELLHDSKTAVNNGTLLANSIKTGKIVNVLNTCADICPFTILCPDFCPGSLEVGEGDTSLDSMAITYKKTLPDEWLIHCTTKSKAESIAMNGFDRGNALGELAYNIHRDNEIEDDEKKYYTGDYLFAHQLSFINSESPNPLPYWNGGAVVFRSSAVLISHANDTNVNTGTGEDTQCVFDYHVPDSFYLLIGETDYRSDKDAHIVGKEGKVLFSGTVPRCITWLQKNCETYEHMMIRP